MSDWLLLIDDDPGIREALAALLSGEGYRVEIAGNGREGLELLERAAQPPGAILLDLMMPVMDGFAFREVQRAHPEWSQIPVVVLTAGLVDARAHALQATCYHRKPIDIDRLLDELQQLVAAP